MLVRRDTGEKAFQPLSGLVPAVRERLDALQAGLLERARSFVAANTTRVASYAEFKQVMADKRGFLVAGWCRDAECEARIKEETKATVRGIPLEGESVPGACVRCDRPSPGAVYFAQAY